MKERADPLWAQLSEKMNTGIFTKLLLLINVLAEWLNNSRTSATEATSSMGNETSCMLAQLTWSNCAAAQVWMAGGEGRHSVNQKQIPGFQSRRGRRPSRPPVGAEAAEGQGLYFFNFYGSVADLKARSLLKQVSPIERDSWEKHSNQEIWFWWLICNTTHWTNINKRLFIL